MCHPPISRIAHARARQLRRSMTPAEVALWERLRRSQLGARFRRQHPLGPFIVDFACLTHKLVVELDGQPHDDDYSDHDANRTLYLERHGYRVLRFENHRTYDDLDAVVWHICQALAD